MLFYMTCHRRNQNSPLCFQSLPTVVETAENALMPESRLIIKFESFGLKEPCNFFFTGRCCNSSVCTVLMLTIPSLSLSAARDFITLSCSLFCSHITSNPLHVCTSSHGGSHRADLFSSMTRIQGLSLLIPLFMFRFLYWEKLLNIITNQKFLFLNLQFHYQSFIQNIGRLKKTYMLFRYIIYKYQWNMLEFLKT